MRKILNEKVINKGFTIMEILVSIFILSIGLVGIYSLINQNIQVQYINKNDLIASQLAQEGIELVRNVRDKNWLIFDTDGNQLHPFYYYIANSNGSQKTFIIDRTLNIADVDDINDTDAILKIDTNGFYNTNSGTNSIFIRLLETTLDSTSSSTNIACTVRWKEKNKAHDHTVRTILYDWR